MCHLSLTDNNTNDPPKIADLSSSGAEAIHAYEDLQAVAGIPLKSLCTDNPSLLVFPHCLGEHQDGIEGLRIFDLEGRPSYEGDRIISCDQVKVRTGNLMGFLGFSGRGFHGTKVEIRSRFTGNSGQDFFLHYLLERVFKINLFNMDYSLGRNDGFDFVYLLFPHLLKRAVQQGLFRQYQTFQRNDSAVKGPLEVGRHLRHNVPFGGKVAYRSRERTFDNPVTQLVRHTIEFIKGKDLGRRLLSSDGDTKEAVSRIVAATNETYMPQKRQLVIARNSRPVSHPYFIRWLPLQQLCLMILNRHTIQFAATTSPVQGILFDGAWLWEEYAATILCDPKLEAKQFIHPTNKDRKGGIRLFDNSPDGNDEVSFSKCYRRIYPDFYQEKSADGSKDGMIVDAKYKRLEQGPVRDDLYQIISYMHTMRISVGGFLYPSPSKEVSASAPRNGVERRVYQLAGYGGTISSLGLPILQNADTYATFTFAMADRERELLEVIEEM